jgi:hypothetical protein
MADHPHPDLVRAVARHSTDYLLRALRLLTDLQEGELLTAIICQAIIAANTSHLTQVGDADPRRSGLPSDDERRPISILALAGTLGLPFETTRRHVNKLIKARACEKVKGGVIVPARALGNPRFLAAAETNYGYVVHFVRSLRRAGLSLD